LAGPGSVRGCRRARRTIAGEADGWAKYAGANDTLWAEKRRQAWMEDELGLFVLCWTCSEPRWAADDVADRWFRLADRRRLEPWRPPDGLRVVEGAAAKTRVSHRGIGEVVAQTVLQTQRGPSN
jgi:hypothetical protein